MNNAFKIGETVWVNTTDGGILKGKVIGFTKTDEKLPIVRARIPWDRRKAFSNAFSLDRINHYKDGKYFKQWRYA